MGGFPFCFILEKAFFSTTPYRFGKEEKAVKYAVFPHKGPGSSIPKGASETFLRERLSHDLCDRGTLG